MLLYGGGGPAYSHDLRQAIPLAADIEKIKAPMYALGLGWYGARASRGIIEGFSFEQKTRELWRRCAVNKPLSCRDFFSVSILRHNGFENAIMTGCPAWYDVKYAESTRLSFNPENKVNKICISEPSDSAHFDMFVKLASFLRKRYPQAEVKALFHRGIAQDKFVNQTRAYVNASTVKELEKIGVESIDISYGTEGFNYYDKSDLHVGFRVHAHIYNLSRRKRSLIIEEDSRGTGVNDALGLPGVKAYTETIPTFNNRVIRKARKILIKDNNPYAIAEVETLLNRYESNGCIEFGTAFERMTQYYKVMRNYIGEIGKKSQ
ncbi:MAG: polysaccharide pyruvyl transferase family protein [Clostridiales bacterium]|jgi:hypothetical protein|nr:polysaccharide pyruvyl transferase family protein [Clostridiales bacterium]